MGRSIGGHQLPNRGQTDEWLTPPEIVKALGPFDLDPCSPINRPWDTAAKHYTIEDNGLMQPWEGAVWLNPPYGYQTGVWLRHLSEHGNGIALVFARTETAMFFESVWPKASGMLFIKGRLSFYDVTGKKGRTNAGGPSVLISYDKDRHRSCPNYVRLLRCGIEGKVIDLTE